LISYFGCGSSKLAAYDGMANFRIRCIVDDCPGSSNLFKTIIKLPYSRFWLGGTDSLWSARIDDIRQNVRFDSINQDSLGLSLPEQFFNALLLQDDRFVWIGTGKSGLVR